MADGSTGTKKTEDEGRKMRFKPGTVALREIKRYQKSVNLVVPRAPFQRLVREVTHDFVDEMRFSTQALLAL